MKVKYDAAVQPLVNEHNGFVFQRSRTCDCITTSKKNDRARLTRQRQKMPNLMKAVSHWRNLDPASKTAWNTFAATYPQPCKNPDSGFLTGYQLFIKRQQYIFLNEGLAEAFLEAPLSQVLTLHSFTVSVDQTENCIDVTEPYIKNYGLIPSAEQKLLIKILPYSFESGQFFAPITQTIEVLESYIDGLFISLHFSEPNPNIIFSVYLSFPTSSGRIYQNTQTRYMGCFTSKTFLQLTDTPDSYEGQAGKIVTVKEDESGLEFSEPSGGGLTCEDLPECPTIISINDSLSSINAALLNGGLSSLPAVNLGKLYNAKCITAASPLFPAGTDLPTKTQLEALRAYYGGTTVAAGALKQVGFEYWLPSNAGASNASKFNARGAGYRTHGIGNFQDLFMTSRFWSKTPLTSAYYEGFEIRYSDAYFTQTYFLNAQGLSIRLVKTSTNLSHGQSGTLVGNNGRVYRTICINGVEWMADNLAETHWRNGAVIPNITDNTVWAANAAAYCCDYNNDPSYV